MVFVSYTQHKMVVRWAEIFSKLLYQCVRFLGRFEGVDLFDIGADVWNT